MPKTATYCDRFQKFIPGTTAIDMKKNEIVKIKQITKESMGIGEKSISVDVEDLVNGVYLLKLNSKVQLLEVNR